MEVQKPQAPRLIDSLTETEDMLNAAYGTALEIRGILYSTLSEPAPTVEKKSVSSPAPVTICDTAVRLHQKADSVGRKLIEILEVL